MTHILYGQNKYIGHINLSKKLKQKQIDPLLQASPLALSFYHYHYPCIYYSQIYQHFKTVLPSTVTKHNIRICYNDKQLPNDLPIGLYLQSHQLTSYDFEVILSPFPWMEQFLVIVNTWKKTFQIVNNSRRCDYIKSKISKATQKEKFQLYVNGKTHNLQFEGLYQGTHIMLRGFYQGDIIQRKAVANHTITIGQLVKTLLFSQLYDQNKQIKVQYNDKHIIYETHGIQLDQTITAKDFLDKWSYNDGYCYVKLKIRDKETLKSQN